jgi:signal transduction histidine kinase
MTARKLHFPIFYLQLILFFTIGSCTKKPSFSIENKTNTAYKIYFDHAEKYFSSKDYDSAFFYYNKIKSTSNIAKEHEKIIYSLLRMSTIEQIQGDYSSSETSATEAISFFQKNTNTYYKCYAYNLLAINYESLFDYNTAIYYYNQAFNSAEDELQKAILKNNIAVVYMDKNDFQKAIQVLLPLILKKKVIDNDENHARILDNLGFSYFKTGNTKKGLDYINQSLKIREQIKDDFGITTSYYHLSEFYSKTSPVLSYRYAQLSYAKATKVNNANDRLKSLDLLIKNSTGNQLKKFTLNYLRINDSINQARQKAKNQFAKIKYDSTKEKNENLILKAQKAENALELEQQKNRNYVSYFFTFLGIISAAFYYYYWQKKSKKEKAKAVYESEIRISKKLHDELANDVYQTMAFAETQDLQNPIKKETLLGNLDKIYSLTRNISRESSKIETGVKFEEELKEMLSGYNNNQVQIIIKDNGDINWLKIQPETKIALHRVLQELMVNMKKHSQCSFVVISFESNEKHIEINYSDNGIGIKDGLILKNGLHNVENRILTINGTITFDIETNKGFKAKIAIPK